MNDRLNPQTLCPTCGNLLDGATCPTEEDASPSEGDLSICLYCGTMLEFQADLTLCKLSDEKYAELPLGERLALDRAAAATAIVRAKGKVRR